MNLSIVVELSVPVAELLVLLQEELDEPIRQLGANVTWVAPERIRILIRRFNDFEPALLPRLRDILRTIAKTHGEFDLDLVGTHLLPSVDTPRFVLVGVGNGDTELNALQKKIDTGLETLGLPAVEGDLRLGVLVGRIQSVDRRPDLRGLVNAFAETPYGTSRIRELVIAESRVTPGHGAQHRILHRYKLGTGE